MKIKTLENKIIFFKGYITGLLLRHSDAEIKSYNSFPVMGGGLSHIEVEELILQYESGERLKIELQRPVYEESRASGTSENSVSTRKPTEDA